MTLNLWCNGVDMPLGPLKSRSGSPVLGLNPYSGLFGLFVKQKALLQHLRTDTSSSGPRWGKKEQTMSVHVPLTIGIVLSHNPGIPAFEGNPASYV